MATTVSLASNTWYTTSNSSNWQVSASSSEIKASGAYIYDYFYHGKAYIIVDVTNYDSIKLTYTTCYMEGISEIKFGIFNNNSSTDTTGTDITKLTKTTSETKTLTIKTSGLTGTKYVGFYLYGNGYRNDYGKPETGCAIISLTGELAANTITYKPGSYASGSTYTATKNSGSSITLRGATYSRTGYTQTGWSTSNTGSSKTYSLSATYSTNADLTLYPYWTANNYTVTLNANGGTSGSYTTKSVTYNSSAGSLGSSYLCSKTDYKFNGFYTASSGGTQIINSSGAFVTGTTCVNSSGNWIYAGNITLYAQYTKNVFTITSAASTTTIFASVSGSVKVAAGGSAKINATTIDKYAFDYWLLPNGTKMYWNSSTANNKTPSRSSDHKTGYLQIDSISSSDEGAYTAYAYREIILDFVGSNCKVPVSRLYCRGGDYFAATATPTDNYIFEGWTMPNGTILNVGDSYDNGRIYCEKIDDKYYLKFTSITVADEGAYTAAARALSFITPVAGTGIDNVSGGVDPYVIGNNITLTCSTKLGYNFYKWQLPNGTQLGKNESSGNVSVNSSGELIITSITENNAGYYTAIASKNFVNKKYHALIYNNNNWRGARSVIIRRLLVPTNAIVDVNDIPILTSDGEFILVDESTEGLTPEYIRTDYCQYVPYFTLLLDTPDNVVYLGPDKPAYSGIGKYIYTQK